MGMWAEKICRSVNVGSWFARPSNGIPSIARICKEIGMSKRIYHQLITGDSPNLRNYLRIIFWCIDHYPSVRREQLMQELANRLRSEFE